MVSLGDAAAPYRRATIFLQPNGPALLTTSGTKIYLLGDDDDNGYIPKAPCRVVGMYARCNVNAEVSSSTCTVTLSKNTEAAGTDAGALYAIALDTGTASGFVTGSDTSSAALTGGTSASSSWFDGSTDDMIVTAINSTGTTLDVLDLQVEVEIEYDN